MYFMLHVMNFICMRCNKESITENITDNDISLTFIFNGFTIFYVPWE